MPTYTTFPTNVPGPSFPVEKQAQPKVKTVQFGDGYTQEAPDGINYNLFTWNLSWDALTSSEKTTIENFLVAAGGYATFQWADPEGTTQKVKCRTWSFSLIEPTLYKLSATFNQVPI
jgi:phage-related protein